MDKNKLKKKINIPEFIVFLRVFLIWFFLAGCFRVFYYIGEKLAGLLANVDLLYRVFGITFCFLVCIVYVLMRDGYNSLVRIGRSYRIDLFVLAIMGISSNFLTNHWLSKVELLIDQANPFWPPILLITFIVMLLSPICRTILQNKKRSTAQFFFLGDDAIETKNQDIMQNNVQAKIFAEAVMASEANSGLVFGIDGPWGIGKTSFVNLAEQYWREESSGSVIVFRFEPLRY